MYLTLVVFNLSLLPSQSSVLPVRCQLRLYPCSGMSKGRALLIFAFCIWETARGGLNATSGMWQAVKAGSPAISGGSLSCCWRFLFTCSANSAGGSWSPASQEKVIVHRVNSIILNNVQFCTLTLQFWDTWGV